MHDRGIPGIMVIHEYLVYELPGGRIKCKYTQEQDCQYLMYKPVLQAKQR